MSVGSQILPDWLEVSRETSDKLRGLLALVKQWNPRINLVSEGSLDQGWTRHVLDSAQLWRLAQPPPARWLDLGSGGGFPGLVISIIADELAPGMSLTLVESDRRKSVFLSEAARLLSLRVNIVTKRIENAGPPVSDIISARAMAPLTTLLSLIDRIQPSVGVALFSKGQSYEEELAIARNVWQFQCEVIRSMTDPKGVVLRIENLRRA